VLPLALGLPTKVTGLAQRVASHAEEKAMRLIARPHAREVMRRTLHKGRGAEDKAPLAGGFSTTTT